MMIGSSTIIEDVRVKDVVALLRSLSRNWRNQVDKIQEYSIVMWAKENKPQTRRPPDRPQNN